MKRYYQVTAILCVAALWLSLACQETTTTATLPPGADLSDPYGGYDDSGMSSATLSSTFDGEPDEGGDEVDDTVGSTPVEQLTEIAALLNSGDYEIHYVRMDWGQLHLNLNKTTLTDFSGSINVSEGGVRLLRKIWFEPLISTDGIVRPRSDVKTLEWNSTTSVHHDGLLVKLITPTGGADPTVTVTIGAFSNSWTISQLDAFNVKQPVGLGGDEVCVTGVLKPEGVHVGYVIGRWTGPEEKNRILARWIEVDGDDDGYLVGFHGTRNNGAKVWFAKYVDENGNYVGIARGLWSYLGGGLLGGTWLGHWVDETHSTAGILGGVWRKALVVDGGFFKGFWIGGETDITTEEEDTFN